MIKKLEKILKKAEGANINKESFLNKEKESFARLAPPQNLPKADAYSLLGEVQALITASNNLIKVSKENGAWNLICDEEIEFEEALQKVREHFS